MWRKEDGRPQGPSEISTGAVNSTMGTASGKNLPVPAGVSPKAAACVSQGIKIKGEISGSEDLFVDGQIEGRITCGNSTVTLVQIVEGLGEGDAVALPTETALQPGSRLTPVL